MDKFYSNAYSSIMENKQSTSRFPIERGCHQGDPLSPYLFLICIDILGMLIRYSHEVKRTCVNSK